MKHKIIVSAGSQVFELIGEITELGEDHIFMKANDGDLYVERKYVVFIHFLKEEVAKPVEIPAPKSAKAQEAAKLLKMRLRQDPLKEKLEQKLVPLSQCPDVAYDNDFVDQEEYVAPPVVNEDLYQPEDPDDAEVMRNVGYPMVQKSSLKDAIKEVMSGDDVDLSFGGPGYKDPLKTILGLGKQGQK